MALKMTVSVETGLGNSLEAEKNGVNRGGSKPAEGSRLVPKFIRDRRPGGKKVVSESGSSLKPVLNVLRRGWSQLIICKGSFLFPVAAAG